MSHDPIKDKYILDNIDVITRLFNIIYEEQLEIPLKVEDIRNIIQADDSRKDSIYSFLTVELPKLRKMYGIVMDREIDNIELVEIIEDAHRNNPVGNKGLFLPLQDLDKPGRMEQLIAEFDMEAVYEVVEVEGSNYIKELYISEEIPDIAISKYYHLEDLTKVFEGKQDVLKDIYNLILENSLEVENYDQAAKYRDLIAELN